MGLSFRWRSFATAALAVTTLACASEPGVDAASTDDELTDIANTSIKRQVVGNCWLYTATAWTEALHLKATQRQTDLSESYLTYWRWFDQLAAAADAQTVPAQIVEGADWETASNLIRRYGVVDEDKFVPETTFASFTSGGDAAALSETNRALRDGASPLRTAMAKRDRGALRRALDALWHLPPALTADLDAAFGPDARRTFDVTGTLAPVGNRVKAPSEIVVASPDAKQGRVTELKLSDLLIGAVAQWRWADSPADANVNRRARRAFETRIQRALHDGLPVPITWPIDFGAIDATGKFSFDPKRTPPSPPGMHMSLIYDYEVRDVPGFGTLPVGEVESRPDALTAALDERANIAFFRVKNSWGLMPSNPLELGGRLLPSAPAFGDHDIEPAYAYRWARAWTFYAILPPGY